MSEGWKGKDCWIPDRNLSQAELRTFLVKFPILLPVEEILPDDGTFTSRAIDKGNAFRGKVSNVTADLAYFFDVPEDHVDVLVEPGSIGARNIQRRNMKSVRFKVLISDDFARFEALLTEISVALGSFLGSNVQLGAVEITCGLGYYRPSCSLDQPCRCAACKISTYKDSLEDVGYEDGCTTCPSEYMETEVGATRLGLDLEVLCLCSLPLFSF